jgi:TIGR03009 family protein
MRRIAGTLVIMVAAASSAWAQNAQPRRQAPPANAPAQKAMAAPVPDPAAMDALLNRWAQQNGKLKTLTVSFVRIDTSKVWGDKTEYMGNAYLQSPNLACLHFKKVDRPAGKPATSTDHERIVCTGQQVRQYDFKTKQIFVFPLDPDQRKRAIQEGPLPFLFNLNAQEAKMRWGMSLIGEDKDNYLIGIKPRTKKDMDVFSSAFLQLSKTTFLPDRMLLVDTNGKDTQDYRFSQVDANQPIDARYFQALAIKGWKVVENPEPVEAAEAEPAPRQQPSGRPQLGARPAAGGARAPR